MKTLLFVLLFTVRMLSQDPGNPVWTFVESPIAGCPSSIGTPRFDRAYQPFCILPVNLCPPASVAGTSGYPIYLRWENLEPNRVFVILVEPGPPSLMLLPCVHVFSFSLAVGVADLSGHAVVTILLPGAPTTIPTGQVGYSQVVSLDGANWPSSSSNLLSLFLTP